MYLTEPRSEVSQGDLFDSVSLVHVSETGPPGEIAADLRAGRAILLTHDCEYDKPANRLVLVAEVRPLSEIPPGSQKPIREYRTRNTFYLEAVAERMPESYVDFRRLTPFPKATLAAQSQAHGRLASLNDEARLALQRQIAIFFGYGR